MMPEEDPEPRLSADQSPLPPSPSPSSSIIDDHDVADERISIAGKSSNNNHHHDLIHKPPPLVIARPKIHDIQIV